MKRIALIIGVAAALTASCGPSSEKKAEETIPAVEETTLTTENMDIKKTETPEFDIVTTYGTMRVRLYDQTPRHRDNFVKLVSEKYYDGIRFHRVIEGFMIQTGDPFSRDTAMINSWGTGGPDYTVPAEFVSEYTHKKGAIAAARNGDMANPKKASSGSQFYIVQDELGCSHLDGQYTVYGEVFEGLEVIDRIAAVATDRYDRPYEDVMIVSVKRIGLPEPQAETPAANDTTAAE